MSEARGRFPNMFLVGAMKAASTSLYHTLAKHRQIFMSRVKEPKYFAFLEETRSYNGPRDPDNQRYWVDRERYAGLFGGAGDLPVVGEASTIYLYSPETAARIHRDVPDARIVILLRDPVERAYSHYCFVRQRGLESEPTFEGALAREDERVDAGWGSTWHYRRMGLYSEQIERYLRSFSREQLFVELYDGLREDPRNLYRRLFDFLGVADASGEVPNEVHNRTIAVRSPAVARVLRRLRESIPPPVRVRLWASPPFRLLLYTLRPLHALNLRAVELAPQPVLESLREHYRPDIRRTEQLLDRDLGAWLGRAS